MDQIDEVRSKIDIVQLVSEYLPLKKAGRNFKALCPFHQEKQPSFIVSPERQIWKCFGCGKGGSVFNFLMEMEGMEFGEALRTLAKRAGVKLVSYRPSGQEAEKERLYGVNHLASEFYHFLLLRHPVGRKALDYLLGRGIKKDSIVRFKLGFAPALPNTLQRFLIGKKGYALDDLQKVGLISRNGGRVRDFFQERIIFPLKDHRGNVTGFSGRVLPGKDESTPKYINIAETPLYHKSALLYGLDLAKEQVKKRESAIIVEGEFDVISSFQVGMENVVAIKGSALTQEQCQLLKRFCETLILALDRDVAGDAAARRGIEIADKAGFEIKVVEIPEGKDPDELCQKSPEVWGEAIVQAVPVYDFFIASALSRFDTGSSLGKRKIGAEVLPVLAKIDNDLVKAHYIKLLAGKMSLPEEAVFAQMEKIKIPEEPSHAPLPKGQEKLSRRQLLEEHLLTLLLQAGKEGKFLEETASLVKTPVFARIVDVLTEYLKKEKEKKFSSQDFAKRLPSELLEIFNGFFLKDLGEMVKDDEWCKREIKRTFLELEKANLQEQLKKLAFEIARLERKGEKKALEAKKEEFRQLSQKLSQLQKQ